MDDGWPEVAVDRNHDQQLSIINMCETPPSLLTQGPVPRQHVRFWQLPRRRMNLGNRPGGHRAPSYLGKSLAAKIRFCPARTSLPSTSSHDRIRRMPYSSRLCEGRRATPRFRPRRCVELIDLRQGCKDEQ